MCITEIAKGEELQAKDTENLLREIIARNFSNLGKDMDIQVQDAFKESQIRHDQKRISPGHSIVKLPKIQTK